MTGSIDHYAVLGIDSQADQEVIRQAWIATARINHPDALGEVEEAERRKAGSRMQAINEAWRVLGSPDLRAGYDKARQREPNQSKLNATEWIEESLDMEPSDPPGFEVGNPYVAMALRAMPWLLAGAIGVGIFVFSAFATNSRSERQTPAPHPLLCVVISEDESVSDAGCEEKAARQVVDDFEIRSRECRDGTEKFEAGKQLRTYCLRPVETDAGP